jgi:hypothetical protein
MSLHNLAKKVQGTGRGQDSMLVHMSPREVQGLQALAKVKGGQLTINPKTGLPEAGFLEDILPMVAAGAAIYFTAGAAAPMLMGAGMGATSAGILAGAGAGALIGGGSAAIQGGDVGKAALMGGVTGAIGGGIGAPSEVPVDPNVALQQATTVGTQAINVAPTTGALVDPLAGAGTAVSGAPAGIGASGMPTPAPTQAGLEAAAQSGAARNAALENLARSQGTFAEGYAGLPGQTPNPAYEQSLFKAEGIANPTQPLNAGQQIMKDQADLVAKNMKDPNASWWSKQTPWEKAGYTTAGAALLSEMTGQANAQVPTEDTSDDGNYLARISPNFQGQAPIQPNPYYQAQYPTYTKKPKYVAQGGLMALAEGGPVERMTAQNMAINPQGGLYPQGMIDKTQYATPIQRPTSLEVVDAGAQRTFAGGGIASLGGYSDGGRLLKGPGTGLSDAIPAVIGTKQPARLADGEFVVSSDVVSGLGGGSTDAGAKKLYAMMDRIRKHAHGTKKQVKKVNDKKVLPA